MNKKVARVWLGRSLVIIISTALEFIAYYNTVKLIAGSNSMAQTLSVFARLHKLESHIPDAASAHRGYLITGKEHHFHRHREAQQETDKLLRQLRSLTPDDPVREHLEASP